jgi:hypothetical protein
MMFDNYLYVTLEHFPRRLHHIRGRSDRQLRAIGPASIADALACGQPQPDRARAAIEAAFAEACWTKAIAADPDLASFDRSLVTEHKRPVHRGTMARH